MTTPSRRGKTVFSIKHGVEKLNDTYEKHLAENDPVFDKPLHPENEKKTEKVLVKGGIDVYFLVIVIALALFGMVMSFSASSYVSYQDTGDGAHYFKRHLFFLIISLLPMMVAILFVRPSWWRLWSFIAYGASVVLLIAVLLTGLARGVAQRWIDIGGITIQPSEIAKMGLVMMLAYIMSKHEKKIELSQRFGGQFRYGVLYPGILIALICGLVAIESHLSGLIILGLLGLFIMYIGGTDKKWMMLIIAVGIAAVIVVLLMSSYAQQRVTTWLDIENAPKDDSYQTLQGLYAIGSGGFFGVGLGNSRQKFGYVPEPQNDFIFTIICEELGFVGAVAVIVLFILLVVRGYKIASKAPDKFCALTVYGLTTKVALQAILNIAVVTNSMPNTGISLPFFSSGGTALVLQMLEMGIILSISRYSYVDK